MLYNSTQNAKEVVSAAQAIAQGISKYLQGTFENRLQRKSKESIF